MASSSQLFLFSFWLCLLFLPQIATSTENYCPLTFSGDNFFPIKFPFQLTNRPTSFSRCVYPGFELSFNRVNQTILHIPDSSPFLVQNIDYITQSLWITDPKKCFPKRLLRGLNLEDYPFVTDRVSNFTFVNCSSDATTAAAADYDYYKVVPCLSGENYTVLAGPTGFYNESTLPSWCVRGSTVSIPMRWGLWSGVDVGIGLVWRRPSCGYCEELDLACRFKTNTGISRNTKYNIILGVGFRAMCCMIWLGCYLCRSIRAAGERHRLTNAELPTTSITLRPAVIATSLDGPTIESYPKTLLGESKPLPEPYDNTCPICLCEYQAEDTVRTIPDCSHYFHADCIDEWLKMKASCPVCRKSPDGSALETPSSASTSSSPWPSTS